jgi:protoheme ferro-lyase
MTKVGVLLLNLGGPERIEDVGPFLYNLFADPEGEVVVAKFSSQSAALDPIRITRTMEWVETIRAHLAG